MQKRHLSALVLGRERLDHRADHHLDERAARRVDDHRQNDRRIRVDHTGQKREHHKPAHGENMRKADAAPPAETVHKYRGKQVNDKLGDEIHGRQHAQPFDADVEIALEDDIKQRQQVVDGRLHDQPVITGHTRGRIRFHKKQTSVRPAEAGRTQSEAEAASLKRTVLFRIPRRHFEKRNGKTPLIIHIVRRLSRVWHTRSHSANIRRADTGYGAGFCTNNRVFIHIMFTFFFLKRD